MSILSFPRSDNPLISITMPTRGRIGHLSRAIQSLMDNSINKDKIEFVFRADADDEASIDACASEVRNLPNAQLWVSPRGRGYLDIHKWTYQLSMMGSGDWIMWWNDDAVMKTPQWDHTLLHAGVQCWHNVPDVYMMVANTKDRPGCTEFILLRRKTIEILGSIGQSPHADNWMTRVMSALGSMSYIPLEVEHFSGQMTDKTREESVAAYADGDTARETLESAWAQEAIRADTQRLLAYILSRNSSGRKL